METKKRRIGFGSLSSGLAVLFFMGALSAAGAAETRQAARIPLSPEMLEFRYRSTVDSTTIPCTHSIERPENLDWKVVCKDRKYSVHLLLNAYPRSGVPRLSYEALYWIMDRTDSNRVKYSDVSLWYHAKDPSEIHRMELRQSVENGAGDLVLYIAPGAKPASPGLEKEVTQSKGVARTGEILATRETLKFSYEGLEGGPRLPCSHALESSVGKDWYVVCEDPVLWPRVRREYRIRFLVLEYQRDTVPMLTYDILLWVEDRSHGSRRWFSDSLISLHLKEPGGLHSLSLSKEVDHGAALLSVGFDPFKAASVR